MRRAVLLIIPTVRTMRWRRVVAGAAVAVAVAAVNLRASAGDSAASVEALRLAALALAVTISFVIADPVGQLSHATPTSPLLRRAVRVLLALTPLALTWTVLVVAVARRGAVAESLTPLWLPASIEAAAMLALALAFATHAARRLADDGIGFVAAGALLTAAGATAWLPVTAHLWTAASEPVATSPDPSWVGVLIASVAAAVYASVDPWATPHRNAAAVTHLVRNRRKAP